MFLLIVLFISIVYCQTEDDRIGGYDTVAQYRLRKFYASDDPTCAGAAYEQFEEPFDHCWKDTEPGSTKVIGFKYENVDLGAKTYERCSYADSACASGRSCETINFKDCAPFGNGHVSESIIKNEERIELPVDFDYALFEYTVFAGDGCSSDMKNKLELSKGRCVKYSHFPGEFKDDHWARFCTYFDDQCLEKIPLNCHVVKLGGCVNRADMMSYLANVRHAAVQSNAATIVLSISMVLIGFLFI
mmetsp:Transcript_17583/g.30770  ORF Transcript_17583/g.30770 Transcript_17583/m.30770 type:complete len:245 (+) Transcript_17583:39-773(+)